MARLIDADALKKAIMAEPWKEQINAVRLAVDYINIIIDEQRAVDAVKVVRCKDCKYSGMYCFGASHEPTFACLDIEEDGFVRMATAADPEGYCSNGERKDND